MVLKPRRWNIQELYLDSPRALGIDPMSLTSASVEDDWENPTLGAWGLGWGVAGRHGGHPVHLFPAGRRPDCNPVLGEITYGIERLAMYLQGVETSRPGVVDRPRRAQGHLRRRLSPERGRAVDPSTSSTATSTSVLAVQQLRVRGQARDGGRLPLPAYEMVLKAAHFNLLDARGAISVTERAAYIGRIRNLSRAVAQAYFESREASAFRC